MSAGIRRNNKHMFDVASRALGHCLLAGRPRALGQYKDRRNIKLRSPAQHQRDLSPDRASGFGLRTIGYAFPDLGLVLVRRHDGSTGRSTRRIWRRKESRRKFNSGSKQNRRTTKREVEIWLDRFLSGS